MIFEIKGPLRRTRPEPFPDKVGPDVKVRVLGKPNLRGLITKGQAFKLTVSEENPPVALDIKLVTRLKRAAGKGSQQATIARARVKMGGSATRRVRIRPSAGYRKKLRKRDLAQAMLIVVATDEKGNRKKTVKRIRFS